MKEYQTSLYFLAKAWLCIVLIFPITLSKGYGQDKVRTYASREEFHGQALLGLLLPGTITNKANAVDQNPRTYSTLSVTVGALNQILATQFLDFERIIPAGTPVTIKLSLPASSLGLIDNFRIQPYINLNRGGGVLGVGDYWRANAAGQGFNGSNLLNLLSGKGSVEFTVMPTSNFEGIWIELGSLLGVAINMDVFHAYILEDAVLPCDEKDKAIDILHGVRAGGASLANATGSVTNPWNAVDGDPNTFTLINTGAQVLSEVYHTTIFQTPSRPHQVANIVLQKEGGGLLDLDLLNEFVIQPYLGSTAVGAPLSNSTLLSLRLLPGTGDIYELSVPVAGSFDRIEIKMGGVANVLNSLRVYEVSRLPELPILDEGSSPVGSDKDICKGDSAVLSAAAPSGATIKWYTQEYGGSIQGEGNQFTTPSLDADTIYYVSSAPEGCSTESPRIPIHIRVHPKPGVPHLILSNTQ